MRARAEGRGLDSTPTVGMHDRPTTTANQRTNQHRPNCTYLYPNRHPEFSEMVLAAGAIDWNLGRFTDGVDKYTYAVERDPRLLDDKYLEVRCCLAVCVCVCA